MLFTRDKDTDLVSEWRRMHLIGLQSVQGKVLFQEDYPTLLHLGLVVLYYAV